VYGVFVGSGCGELGVVGEYGIISGCGELGVVGEYGIIVGGNMLGVGIQGFEGNGIGENGLTSSMHPRPSHFWQW